MPCNYTRDYPPNWKTEIRPRILARAGNKCECCGVKNGAFGYRSKDGRFYSWQYIEAKLENEGIDFFDTVLSNCFDKQGNPTKAFRIVLTIAHLDHNTRNNDHYNLKAMCQRCHLQHDRQKHKETRKKNKGLQSLF